MGWDDDAAGLVSAALERYSLVMLQVLHRLGFRWQPAAKKYWPPAQYFLAAVMGRGCSVPLLAWLLEAGCPVDWPEVLAAAGRDPALNPVVKTWLKERSSPL